MRYRLIPCLSSPVAALPVCVVVCFAPESVLFVSFCLCRRGYATFLLPTAPLGRSGADNDVEGDRECKSSASHVRVADVFRLMDEHSGQAGITDWGVGQVRLCMTLLAARTGYTAMLASFFLSCSSGDVGRRVSSHRGGKPTTIYSCSCPWYHSVVCCCSSTTHVKPDRHVRAIHRAA